LGLAIQQWRAEMSGALLKQGGDAALERRAQLSSSRLGHHSHMARISAV
jgi:hypothetical protein